MVGCLKLFIAILLLGFVGKGLCRVCSLDNLNVGQARTWRIIGGKPEWNVTVTNNCKCTRANIVLSCSGFQTSERIDPNLFVLKPNGQCLLNGGRPLSPFHSVQFSYAWDPPFFLLPAHADQINCF